MNFYTIIDGRHYTDEETKDLLMRVEKIRPSLVSIDARDKWVSISFVGVVVLVDCVICCFPKRLFDSSMNGFDGEAERLMSLVAQSLIRFRDDYPRSIEDADLLYSADGRTSTPLLAAMEIIQDYEANGLIRRFLTSYSQNKSGRIAWNRTIQRENPIFTGTSVFYPSPIIARKIDDKQSPLTILHKACVQDCYERWGWLINPERYPINFRQHAREWLPYTPETALAYLAKERWAVFSDREIHAIDLLMQYISAGVDTSKNEISFFGTKTYWRVWEAACKYIFHDDQFIYDNLLPQPKWSMSGLKPDTSQRPDVLFVENDTFYILDAKYYDYQRNMPGGPDIIKQYYYEDTLRSILCRRKMNDRYSRVEKTTNAFVFPKAPEGKLGADSYFIGNAYIERLANWRKIPAFALDIRKVLSLYVDSANTDEISRIWCDNFRSKSNYPLNSTDESTAEHEATEQTGNIMNSVK